MLKILKYLKSYWYLVILIIIIAFIEIKTQIAVPENIGKMISNGIERAGVIDNIPLVIDKETMEYFKETVERDQLELVLKSYKEISDISDIRAKTRLKNIFFKDIEGTKLKDRQLYIFSNDSESEREKIDKILFNSLKLKVLEKQPDLKEIKQNQSDQDQMASLVIQEIREIYSDEGLDINKLQTGYIKSQSLVILKNILITDMTWIFVILLSSLCASRVTRDVKQDLFNSVMTFSQNEVDKISVSSLITRLTNDVLIMQDMVYYLLTDFFFFIFYGFMAFKRAYLRNIEMSGIIIVIVVIMLILGLTFLRLVTPRYKKIQKLMDHVNLIVKENLSGILTIRSFNKQSYEEARFDKTNKEFYKTKLYVDRKMGMIDPLIMLIHNLATVVIVWVSYKYILRSEMLIGDITVYINYTLAVIYSFLTLSMILIGFPKAYVSGKRITEVLKTSPSVKDPDEGEIKELDKDKVKGDIIFENVSFRYPTAKENVLKNISFEIKPGETTAIVGLTGSGKSSIINLILRFYDVTSGKVLLDGINIKEIPQKTLREFISYAPQKAVLFRGDIKSNIKYGNESVTDEEIEKVIKITQLEEFIKNREGGLSSDISQGSDNISGGQRQRLSIARALLKKSKVYLFDDTFSALDFKTDLAIREAMRGFLNGASIVIIAQRINTVINADQIIVLKDGQIMAIGKHEDLLKRSKEYQDLVVSQLNE